MNTLTTDTLNERGRLIRVGILPLYVRPLTLSQVIEIGEVSAYMKEFDADEAKNEMMAKYAFSNTMDIECVQEIAIIAVFRRKFMRRLFGWYIKRNLTSAVLKRIMPIIFDTFDYAFFFTSTLFLSGVKKVAGMKGTDSARGDLSEE